MLDPYPLTALSHWANAPSSLASFKSAPIPLETNSKLFVTALLKKQYDINNDSNTKLSISMPNPVLHD